MPRKTSSKSSQRRKPSRRRRFSSFNRAPRGCKLCKEKIKKVDYKDSVLLQKFVTEQGKIIPGRISGNCASHQRRVARAVRKARVMAILPFVND